MKIAAVVLIASTLFAAPAAVAQAVTVTDVEHSPGSVSAEIHSSLFNGDRDVGRFEFKGETVVGSSPFDYFTYSVDLAHSVATGNVDHTGYSIEPRTTLPSLTTAKSNALNALLVNTGSLLGAATGQNAINIAAATQLAVWEIMFETQANWSVTNTTSAFYVTTPDQSTEANTQALASAEQLANSYLSNVANNNWRLDSGYQIKLLYSQSEEKQVFLSTVAPVPEPSIWATMLIGIAGIGSALRRRVTSRARLTVA